MEKRTSGLATCSFFKIHPEARTRQTSAAASDVRAAGSTLTMEVDADVRELRRRVRLAILMDSHHTIDEEAIRDGPKHAEQKEGPQIGGANMVCLRFHVNK